MRICLLLLAALLPHLSCSAPGPLSADRKAAEFFGPSEDNLIVVDAVLIVDAPLPPVILRRTAAPGVPYAAAAAAVQEASVSIHTSDEVFEYHPDLSSAGRYLPPDDAPPVEPDRDYELRVEAPDDPLVRATTRTPPRIRIDQLLLLDDDLETELRRLKLFSEIGDQVYEAAENQLELFRGVLQVRVQNDGDAASYQFGATNLEHFSPLLIDQNLIDNADLELERQETSPLLRLVDGEIFLAWNGIFYAGRYKVKLFAVDENWFDLVRTDNVDSERGSGETGQGFQRPLFHVENGIGLFASASVDSFGFFVRPTDSPECFGCECWGCEERPSDWTGRLDPNTGSGSLDYRAQTRSTLCELLYEIAEATEVEPCANCSFGWQFTLGEPSVISDNGRCEEASGLSGTTVRLAQGTDRVRGGVETRYRLYDGSGAGWEPIEEGWSMISLAPESAGDWLFGY